MTLPTPPSPALLAAHKASVRPATSHGRVGADGTVYVRAADGSEIVVGTCAPEAAQVALDRYARHYQDLRAEVELTTRRLREGHAAPDASASVATKARAALTAPAMIGDLGELESSVTALEAAIAAVVEERRARRAQERAAALRARTDITVEAESLATSTKWKPAGDRYKELLDAWKAAPRVDRTAEKALWDRFSAARAAFDKRRRTHFATREASRAEAGLVKAKLVKDAQALTNSRDWKATTTAYRDLLAKWKAAGPAARGEEESLWESFRAAQDQFFAARAAVTNERNETEKTNLAAKMELVVAAEAIDVAADIAAAKGVLRSIQERFDKIGDVSRSEREAIETRLRKVEERVRNTDQERWKKVNPEAQARAEATVRQFESALEDLRAKRVRAVTADPNATTADIDARIEVLIGLRDAAQAHLTP